MTPAARSRFLATVGRLEDLPSDACLIWPGGRQVRARGIASAGSYGLLWDPDSGRHLFAHRVAWELHHGPIPEGLCVCHRCDVRLCVNPAHLFVGTTAANLADASRKGRLVQALDLSAQREIRARLEAGETKASVARRFGVWRNAIYTLMASPRWEAAA